MVTACQMPSAASRPPTESNAAPPVATASPAPSPAAVGSPRSTSGCGSAIISIDYLPYTIATLVGYGWDFVLAEVVGFDPAIFNTPDGSPPPGFPGWPSRPDPSDNRTTAIYTPANVVIDHAISGSWSPGPNQFIVEGGTVLLESGPVGCFEWRVSPAPSLRPGSRYVLILSEALDDNGQNPLPLRVVRFAWPVDPAGFVSTSDGRMSIDKLTEIVRDAAPSHAAVQ
jgi:hypothetical protein